MTMQVKASLAPLPVGSRIRKGDWWVDQFGYWEQRQDVRWFERVTPRHAPHYRVVGLWSPPPKWEESDEQ